MGRPLKAPVPRKWSGDHPVSTRGRRTEGSPRPPFSDACSRGRAAQCGLVQACRAGALSRSSRAGYRRILAVRSGSVRDPLCAATRSWARSGPMAAAPTVEVGLLDSAATAAAPRRGSGARKNVLVERVPWQGTAGRSLRSDSLASTSLRSAGAEAPLVRGGSTVAWAIADRHQDDPETSASVDRCPVLGRWSIPFSPGLRTRESGEHSLQRLLTDSELEAGPQEPGKR